MRLSHAKYIQRALEGPPPQPSARDVAAEAIPHLRHIAGKPMNSFVDVIEAFGSRGEPAPLEPVSFVDPSWGTRRWGWLVPGGHPDGGMAVVAVDDGENVLVPVEALERTGRKSVEQREAFRAQVQEALGTGGGVTCRADLNATREPTPVGERGDHQLLLQYNAMYGAPSDDEIRRYLALHHPTARYLDADTSFPGRVAVMLHIGGPKMPPISELTQRDFKRMVGEPPAPEMAPDEEAQRRRNLERHRMLEFMEGAPPAEQPFEGLEPSFGQQAPGDVAVDPVPGLMPGTGDIGTVDIRSAPPTQDLPPGQTPGLRRPRMAPYPKPRTPAKKGSDDPAQGQSQWRDPTMAPRQPGAQGEELEGTGRFGAQHAAGWDYGTPVNRSPVLDPSNGVQAPYSAGNGALSVREDAPGAYRMATPDAEAGTSESEMPPAFGGEVVETFDPKQVAPVKPKARRVRRAAPVQTMRSLKEVADSLIKQVGTDPALRTQVTQAVGEYLDKGGLQMLLNKGQISTAELIGQAVKYTQGSNPKLFRALSSGASRSMDMTKPGPVQPLGKDELFKAWQWAKQRYKNLPPIDKLDDKQIAKITQMWNDHKGMSSFGDDGTENKQQQPTPDQSGQPPPGTQSPAPAQPNVGPQQSTQPAPVQVGPQGPQSNVPDTEDMSAVDTEDLKRGARRRRTAAPSAFARYNLPPTTLDIHRMLRMDKVVARGDYLIARVVWDPKDFDGQSSTQVKQAVLSFTKTQGSWRDRQLDWGHIGAPRFLMFDAQAGMAELAIRSSNAKGFQQEVVVEGEAPTYNRYV